MRSVVVCSREMSVLPCLRRRLLLVAVSACLIGACQSEDALEDDSSVNDFVNSAVALPPPALVGSEAAIIQELAKLAQGKEDLARAKVLATTALQKVLFDPSSVQFLSIRMGRNGAVCGKYNAKNRFGAYVGFRDFVVTKDGDPVTSDSNDGLASVPRNYFAAAYLIACANAKERSDYLNLTEPEPAESEPVPQWDDLSPSREHQEPDAVLDAPPATILMDEETT